MAGPDTAASPSKVWSQRLPLNKNSLIFLVIVKGPQNRQVSSPTEVHLVIFLSVTKTFYVDKVGVKGQKLVRLTSLSFSVW